ncbi:MAG: MBL fold metallo-hydrolase [Bacteroidota bacterium]
MPHIKRLRRSSTSYLTVFLCVLLLWSSCNQKPQSNDAPTNSGESIIRTSVQSDQPYLVVLGVAQDAGYPQINCQKACCKRVHDAPHLGRKVTCLALVDPPSGKRWLFEATPDIREQITTLDEVSGTSSPAPVDGIFLTHAHMGHYTGLMHLGREAMNAQQVPVYAMPRMRTYLSENGPWRQLVDLGNIALSPLKADSTISLTPDFRVTPLQVPHRDEFSETVGYRLEGPKKTVLFIPDIDKWERWDRDIKQLIAEVDVALLDGTFYANGEIPGRDMSEIPHPFMEESMARFASLPDSLRERIYFIHFNHTNPVLEAGGRAEKEVHEAGFHVALELNMFEL